MQHAHVATDAHERADDGYPYNPHSDYYAAYRDSSANSTSPHDAYNDTNSGTNISETEFQGQAAKVQGFFNVMVRVLEPGEERALATMFRTLSN